MIRSDVINNVTPLPGVLEAVAPAAVVPDSTHDPLRLTPGMRLLAQVEAHLGGGGFRVRVGDTPMQMQLPPGTAPGTRLELVFVGDRPRMTFLLQNPPSPATGNAVLSSAARLLGTLAREAKSSSAATPPYQADPVIEHAPDDTAEFSARLQQAFSRSGLFYESHQAQWVSGLRTREQLLQDPQGRLSTGAARAAAAEITTDHDGSSPLPATPRYETPAGSGADAPGRIIHKEAMPHVQQQLAALETGQMNWRGEVWPGQTMDWTIEGEPPDQDTPEDAHRWRSRLLLSLPSLGQVEAIFTLEPHGVRIALSAENAPAAETLRSGQPFLVRALHGAGLGVSGIEVRRDDK